MIMSNLEKKIFACHLLLSWSEQSTKYISIVKLQCVYSGKNIGQLKDIVTAEWFCSHLGIAMVYSVQHGLSVLQHTTIQWLKNLWTIGISIVQRRALVLRPFNKVLSIFLLFLTFIRPRTILALFMFSVIHFPRVFLPLLNSHYPYFTKAKKYSFLYETICV